MCSFIDVIINDKGGWIMNGIKGIKNMYNLLTVCLILVGLILLLAPGIALNTVCIVFGIYLIVYGVVKVIGYFAKDVYQLAFQFDLALGIVAAIVGIVFVCRTSSIVQLLSTCIGIVMLVDATLKIQTALDSKRFGISSWWIMLIMAVIVAALGILLILMPGETTRMMIRLIGLNLCLDGVLNLIIVINTVKTDRSLRG
jgi:uncharacterized membrane protein HdeD (DUF308 family)